MGDDVTDPTQAEISLRDAEQGAEACKVQNKLIVSMMSDIVWHYYVNSKGDPIGSYISPVADRMLGLPEGAIGNSFDKYFSYVYLKDSQVAHEILSELLQTPGKHKSAEYRLLKADGTTLWVCFKGSSCIQAGGQVAALGVITDITERRQFEAMLADREERYRHLFEHMKRCVVIYESVGDAEDFIIKDINPAGERTEGVLKIDAIGRSVLEVFPGVKDFGLFEVFQRVWRTGSSKYYPLKYYKDNRVAGWRSNYVYRLQSGEIVAIYDDLTEEKQAHEELRKTNAFLDSIIENIPDMIFIKDASDLRFVRFNRAGEDLLGYSREDLLGKNDYDFFPKEQADFFTTKDREVLAKKLNVDIPEELIRTHTKGPRVLHTKKIPILDESGQAQYLLGISEDITERKRAEEALINANQFNQQIINQAGEGIIVYDLDLRYVKWNRFMENLTGLPAEEVIGKKALDLFPHLQEQGVDRLLYRALSGEAVTSPDTHFYRRDSDHSGWVMGKYAPHRNAKGEIIGVVATVFDITDRKLAEDALRNSEERYRSVVENAAEGIIVAQDGKLMYANPKALHMVQADPEAISDKPFVLFIHPDDRALVLDRYQRRIDGEVVPQNYDFRVIGKRGLVTWVQISAVRIIWNGRPATLNFLTDVTGRKMVEEALREREELYRTVVSSASDGIILQESTGKILTWNRAAERVFGITSDEALGHTSISRLWRTIREDGTEFPGGEHPSIKTLMTGEPCKNVVMGVMNAVTDQLSWININTTPLFKEFKAKPYAVVISFSDITERKIFEDELENRVNERTLELESQTAEMERFIYTVSHDLRSPLVTVSGFLGLLEQDLVKGDIGRVKTDLYMIQDSIKKMDRLLGDTLELSRIGRVANPPEDIPMEEIVQEALLQTSEILRARGVEVSVAPDLPVVRADRLRITEVLVNLIENSVKYMGDEPEPCVDIGLRTEGSETIFFVQDNGMGIDSRQHEDVFDLFYKVNPKSAGTGAGLAIVKRIIEVHGGRIWIESEIGKGCTVCFTLPLAGP